VHPWRVFPSIQYTFAPSNALQEASAITHQQLGFQHPTANMALSNKSSMMRGAAATQRPTASPRLIVPRAAAVDTQTQTYSGKLVKGPQQGQHFLHIDDFSKAEILDMLERAKEAKERLKLRDTTFKPFKDMSMAMIFTKPSARTRVSFETVSSMAGCPNTTLQP
jgi:hypothetical protein